MNKYYWLVTNMLHITCFGLNVSSNLLSFMKQWKYMKILWIVKFSYLLKGQLSFWRHLAVFFFENRDSVIQAWFWSFKKTKSKFSLWWPLIFLIFFQFSGSLDAHHLMEILLSKGMKIRLLDLKRGDIRPGLANLRNRGIQNFIVDIGAEYLKLFFEEVRNSSVKIR